MRLLDAIRVRHLVWRASMTLRRARRLDGAADEARAEAEALLAQASTLMPTPSRA